MAKDEKKIDHKKVQDEIELVRNVIAKEGVGAEAFLITFHFVKAVDGKPKEKRLVHHFNAHDFPTRDWGSVMIATGVEARRAAMIAGSGASKT